MSVQNMSATIANPSNLRQTWSQVSVSEFIRQANWRGEPVALPMFATAAEEVIPEVAPTEAVMPQTLPALPRPVLPGDWQQLTVEQFFRRNNWQGREQATDLTSHPSQRLMEWRPTLSTIVSEFFERLPWQAQPMIAALPEPEEPVFAVTPEREMTLSDFSDLF